MEKLKEFFSFIVCVAVILGIARYTGFLEGFAASDFQKAFYKITKSGSNAGKGGLADAIKSKMPTDFNINESSKYGEYHTIVIPKNVLDASESGGSWMNVLHPSRKVVFYVYDETNKNPQFDMKFHKTVEQFARSQKLSNVYNFEMVTLNLFSNYALGDGGPDKMCDSLQECNEYRKKAASYQQMADFMRRCGRFMCVINPDTNQYIILKKRDAEEAKKLLMKVRAW